MPSATVSNILECPNGFTVHFYVEFVGDAPSDAPALEGINYLGNLELVDDVPFLVGGAAARRFILSQNEVPGGGTIIPTLRFSFTPTQNTLISSYRFFVGALVINNNPEDCPDGLPTLLQQGTVQIASNMVFVPLNGGPISSLINQQFGYFFPNPNSTPDRVTLLGDLIIDQDYTMDGVLGTNLPSARAKLYLSSGAKIIIKAPNTLTLEKVDIFTCDRLAVGIIVEPGATLIADDVLFSDCEYAIDAKPASNIRINNSAFVDNYVGIKLDMNNAGGSRLSTLVLSRNTFTTIRPAIKPSINFPVEGRGYAGFLLKDYRDFNVFGGGRFSRLVNGIVATESSMNIGNMSFTDMNPSEVGGGIYPEVGNAIRLISPTNNLWANINEMWTRMSISNCLFGVKANGYAGNVENVTMVNVGTGIEWGNSKMRDILLKNNTISARSRGIHSFENEPLYFLSSIQDNTINVGSAGSALQPSAGIRCSESNGGTWGWLMLSNTISMSSGGVGIDYKNGSAGGLIGNTITSQSQQQNYTGIRADGCQFTELARNTITQSLAGGASLGASQGIRSSGGVANIYNCNCLDNTNVGIQFYDLSNFTNNVRGNNFNTHVTGMQLGDPNWTASYIGTQFHRGNKWDLSSASGTNGDFGAVNYNQFGLISSKFWVDGMENSSFSPAVDPGSGWFVPDPLASLSYTCSSACSFPPGFVGGGGDREETEITELDGFVLNGSIVGSTEQLWKSKYQLYRRILRQPTLANNDQYSNWLSTQQHTSVGELATMAEMRLHIYDLDAADQTQAEVYRNGLSVLSSQIATADSTRLEGTTIDANQYNTLYQSKTVLAAQSEQFWATIRANQNAAALDLIERNASIATTGTSDANHKTVNHILLSMAAGQSITKEDLSILDAIAEQCPSEAGDAVYEARAVAGHYLGKAYNDTACKGGERNMLVSGASATGALEVFPNPAQNVLYWTNTSESVDKVFVYNILGQLVLQSNVRGNMLHISTLENGTYTVQFVGANGTMIANKKVIVFAH